MLMRIALQLRSPLVRAGLAAGLAEAGEVEIVTAGEGADVRIVEWQRGGALPADGPPTLLLIDAAADAAPLLAHGHAVLPTDAPLEAMRAAAQAAAAGLVATTAELAAGAWRRAAAEALPAEPLTARELEVLRHLARGERNREIGAALAISEHTAKFHVAQIIAKLRASSRAHAVAKALRAGLVEDS
jgi:DNA-binding CsgD family transcriptional regulator